MGRSLTNKHRGDIPHHNWSLPVTRHDLCVGRLPTQILDHMEVPLDHLDNGSPPAAGLLVTCPGVNLDKRNVTSLLKLKFEKEVIGPHLNLLLLLELRLGRGVGREADAGEGELGLGLPTLLERELNLILKDVRDKGLVVGSVLALNLDKDPVCHGLISRK